MNPFFIIGRMRLLKLLFLGALFTGCSSLEEPPENLIQYIDPMIGTDAHGHTFPGATVPFGMIQLSPSNGFKDWDWCSGYHYSDHIIKGFAHNHISGPGLSGLGDFLIMPTSKLQTNSGTDENPESGYRSRFSHVSEKPSAGYYTVRLDDEAIKVELTATERTGYHKYTFETAGEKFIILDPTHSIGEYVWESEIQVISDQLIRGARASKGGSTGKRKAFFEARFSKPFRKAGITQEDLPIDGNSMTGKEIKGYAVFDVKAGESIEIQVTLSNTSYEGVRKNWESEGPEMNFAKALEKAENKWQNVLEKIVIKDSDLAKKKKFYTAMYHAFISPNIISDVDGRYFLEGKVRTSNIPQYSNFSTWDTYRALHPLFTIIEQQKTSELISSMISRHSDEGLILPGWEAYGFDNICMIGYNMTSPIADAVLKDIKGIDHVKAYQAIRAAAFDKTKNSPNYDVNGMDEYLKYGYVTAETGSSVSKTTEQNYYDWAISNVASKLGKNEDAKLFKKRSKGWRSLYDQESGYLFPKMANGKVVKMDTTRWSGLRSNYVSGNIWAYSAYTPHDMKAAIQLHGGRESYLKWLDGLFQNNAEMDGEQHVDISGFIGKYGHGDEPGHQMPYLYAVVGQPWKTQKYVNEVVTTMYSDKPDGLINNEDLGQMSAWYIFSTLGFYPLAPGDLTYQLGAPLYDRAEINLENGKVFTVIAENISKDNIYIQSAKLNGVVYNKSFISHNDIMNGGELFFVMGAKPNKEWASEKVSSFLGDFDDKSNPQIVNSATPAPFDISSDYFFASSKIIHLDNQLKQSEIYYTLDGTTPTAQSKKYIKPFLIKKNVTLKAIAIADGLNASAVFEKRFFKSFLLDLPAGYPKIYLTEQETPYGKAGCSMFFDQIIGSETYSDGKWTGLKDDFSIVLDLGENRSINEITIGALTDTGVWIFPPDKIEIGLGSTKVDIQKVLTKEITPLTKDEKLVARYEFDLNGKSARYISVHISNYGEAPAWHGAGKGQKMWLFVDEIILN